MSTPMRRLRVDTRIGRLTLVAQDQALVGIYFPAHRVQPERAEQGEPVQHDGLLDETARQLDDYLAGRRTRFDLPLAPQARSELEAEVWQLLQRIEYGTTTTYGDLARHLGDPHLAQAVGGAVGRNPLSIVIPCHRVVGSDGGYTGFAGGERLKAWLLGHEAYVAGSTLLPPEDYVA